MGIGAGGTGIAGESLMIWYTEYKKRKASEKLAAQEWYKTEETLAEHDILTAKNAMIQKPCPVRGMEFCFDNCVHFQEGCIFYELPHPGSGFSGHWVREYPKCKLWGRD